MIHFTCRCGHLFEEPDDAAGAAVQCPRCMLLSDVPSHDELDSIGLDGTYEVGPRPDTLAPAQLNDTIRTFASTKIVRDDQAIDLRDMAGDEEDLVGDIETVDQARRRQRPRYDPETGELIQPLAIAKEPVKIPAESIPFAKPVMVVNYEMPAAYQGQSYARTLLKLVRPMNLFVLFFVVLLHFFILASLAAVASGMFLAGFILIGLIIFTMANWANVIDEIGVREEDELPRVGRDLALYEDILWPFAHFLGALILSYGVALAAYLVLLAGNENVATVVGIALAVPGTIIFPAIFLTLSTSGSIANLRPDRVISVMNIDRRRYYGLVFAFVLAVVPYALGLVGLSQETLNVNPFHVTFPVIIPNPPVETVLLLAGMFLMQAFCWEMGMVYRADSGRYPWVNRLPIRDDRPPVVRRKPRYVTPPPNHQQGG